MIFLANTFFLTKKFLFFNPFLCPMNMKCPMNNEFKHPVSLTSVDDKIC
jgi:hypothetical protein